VVLLLLCASNTVFLWLTRYTPTVSAVLKNAWIQYLAFFAVISFLLFRLNSFVFRHKVNLSSPVPCMMSYLIV
jgi:hypothetical protein